MGVGGRGAPVDKSTPFPFSGLGCGEGESEGESIPRCLVPLTRRTARQRRCRVAALLNLRRVCFPPPPQPTQSQIPAAVCTWSFAVELATFWRANQQGWR